MTNWVSDGDYETYDLMDDTFIPDAYLKTESQLRLRIKSVNSPVDKPQPLWVTVEIAAEGKHPVALSQEQLSVMPSAYGADFKPAFGAEVSRVFTVHPSKPLVLRFAVPTDKLQPGRRQIAVWVNVVKLFSPRRTRQFDYQWLEEIHSDFYYFDLK